MDSPLEVHARLGSELGVELLVKRDDLLPFPLPGNKVRKLTAELAVNEPVPDVVITNGGIDSNHCRTIALMAARMGFRAHLVLHGDPSLAPRAASLLSALGATYDVVDSSAIAGTIAERSDIFAGEGYRVQVIPGGCHTPAGARAYRDAAAELFTHTSVDAVVVASGTGATQGGIVAAAAARATPPRVIGVSVARDEERGRPAVREAAMWAGATRDTPLEFLDRYRDGGYGRSGTATAAAVALGWRFGLPLDPTYTGKAFAGLQDLIASGSIGHGSRVLFWHTGGLWNYLSTPLEGKQAPMKKES